MTSPVSFSVLTLSVLSTVFLAMAMNPPETLGQEPALKYPTTRRSEQVDDYHGTRVADPFRWLEDPDSKETEGWVEAQNKVTFSFLEKAPRRDEIRARLTKLWNYPKYGLPTVRGGNYFYEHNDGLQNQSVLYVVDSLEGEPRVLLDPNALSNEGTVNLAEWVPSGDGKLIAYSLASDGSDWRSWKVMEVESGETRSDLLEWVKFSGISWAHDNNGFYYSRYDQPEKGEEFTAANYYHKLYFHQLGTAQSEDQLVYQRKDEKEWGFDGEVTEDGKYLVIHVWKGTLNKNLVFYKDLSSPESEVVPLISSFQAEYEFLGSNGSRFWFKTDESAPLQRVIEIDVENPSKKQWREVIAESKNVIASVNFVGDHFFVSYLNNAYSQVKVFDALGKFSRDVQFEGIGSASGFGGQQNSEETFFSFSSFTRPSTVYHYDVASGETTLFRQPKLEFDPDDFETKQVFYASKDGTRIPMFISSRKGVKLDGSNPTMLYGYGGFNISITPRFSVSNLAWMEAGGIYAVATLRGGGEFGRDWHEAGMLDKKQNVFDDFIAGAEWLIENRVTRSEKLSIIGYSNGGLLVGATMIQRPDLFAAAIPGVGVMDMLRFHQFTIGYAWVSEYGSSDDSKQLETLLQYSPLHNLKKGVRYPATMVLTADHDDRVVPAHSHKFAATLQASQQDGGPPCLIRIQTSGGHGAGKPTAMRIEEATDTLSFLNTILKGPFND